MKIRIASFKSESVVILLLAFIIGASSCAVTNLCYIRLNDSGLTEVSKRPYKLKQKYVKQEPVSKQYSGKGEGNFLTWIFGGMYNLTTSNH